MKKSVQELVRARLRLLPRVAAVDAFAEVGADAAAQENGSEVEGVSETLLPYLFGDDFVATISDKGMKGEFHVGISLVID